MDEVQQVKDKIDIVDFIGGFITLKKAGRNFKAVCPFHTEKSPSFVVSAERQIWHCFGCQKGGDIFSFLTEYEKIDFSEALKDLAAQAGVKLSVPVARSETEEKKERFFSFNHLACQFYSYLLLNHKAGTQALSYLTEKRSLSLELIKKFGIGYAPAHDSPLAKYLLRKKRFLKEDVINAGLITPQGYDFFRNRIVFPIKDARGNIIAFSGRVIATTSDAPKYINTRETLIYKKGETLYGLYEAREAIKKENRVILVEGEFDVISSFKEGIPNTVAVKGTALTEQQIKLLKRYTEKISFCFDSDQAGIDAQQRSIALIEKEGLTATVIVPPEGKDPDAILRENPLLYKKALKNDVPMYDFLIDSIAARLDPTTSEGKRRILDKVLPYLITIDNEVIKEHYFKKVAGLLDTSFDSVVRQAEKISLPVGRTIVTPNPIQKVAREEKIEFYLLALILQAKDLKTAVVKSQTALQDIPLTTPSYNKLYKHMNEFQNRLQPFTIIELAKTLPSELMDVSDKCYLAPLPQFESAEKYFEEVEKTAHEARTLSVKSSLKKIIAQIRTKEKEEDEGEVGKLNEEFGRLTKLLHQK